jgi:hypothetical protein
VPVRAEFVPAQRNAEHTTNRSEALTVHDALHVATGSDPRGRQQSQRLTARLEA